MESIYTEANAAKYLGVSIRSLQRWRTDDERLEFKGPKFIRLGEKRIGYRLSDLNAWIESRAACNRAEELARASKRGAA